MDNEKENLTFRLKDKKVPESTEKTFRIKAKNEITQSDNGPIEENAAKTRDRIKGVTSTIEILDKDLKAADFRYEHSVDVKLEKALRKRERELKNFLKSIHHENQIPKKITFKSMGELGQEIIKEAPRGENSSINFEYKNGNLHVYSTYEDPEK